MPLPQILQDFTSSATQCETLIANAHGIYPTGAPLLPAIDQQQITKAAFLNLFIAWETFLEASLIEFIIGGQTISGRAPMRYVTPPNAAAAHKLVILFRPFFDYANHDNFKSLVNNYFQNGYPYEPHISGLISDLSDIKTIRNACAHVTSTTQDRLETLALRINGQPAPGITVYQLLTSIDARSARNDTVFVTYKNKLSVTAGLIAQG